MISNRTLELYRKNPPQRSDGRPVPELAELIHEIEVAVKVGISRKELAEQIDLQPELFESLVVDTGLEIG
jgi:hypothetical protein